MDLLWVLSLSPPTVRTSKPNPEKAFRPWHSHPRLVMQRPGELNQQHSTTRFSQAVSSRHF